jgi:hypothetical protein
MLTNSPAHWVAFLVSASLVACSSGASSPPGSDPLGQTGSGGAGAGSGASASGNGGGSGAQSSNGSGGAGMTSSGGGQTTGGASSGSGGRSAGVDGGTGTLAGDVAVNTTTGIWRASRNASTGRFEFLSPDGKSSVLRGISMTGLETGTRETASGGGYWLYNSSQQPASTDAPNILGNVIDTLATSWKTSVVRIPICGSAWAQNYNVHDWGNQAVATYKDWVDDAVKKARSHGAVVIIDNHLWAIAKMSSGTNVDRGTFTSNGQTRQYKDYEDGCTGINQVSGTDSCAPSDWYTADPNTWECAIANADGVSMYNAYKNETQISSMWADIANRYKGDSGVWFELFNEPYSRKATTPFPSAGTNEDESDYPWDLWTEYMLTQIKAIRDQAQASNMVLVNGLDWGYDFGPEYGPIAHPDQYLPWATKYANVAYGFHPYQHGSCCGQIGASGTDLSATDPYESGFCSYYADGSTWGAASGAALPGGKTCTNNGYAATQDKKMPPCTWVDTAMNPATHALGLCAGDRTICGPKTKDECNAVDRTSPSAGGWSKYVLPMAKFGPLVATEFGSFDCSSAFTKTLLRYMNDLGISYTAWALWPQNSGGPAGLGACGYPSVMTPAADPGDFRSCSTPGACASLMQPLPWSGQATYDDLTSH